MGKFLIGFFAGMYVTLLSGAMSIVLLVLAFVMTFGFTTKLPRNYEELNVRIQSISKLGQIAKKISENPKILDDSLKLLNGYEILATKRVDVIEGNKDNTLKAEVSATANESAEALVKVGVGLLENPEALKNFLGHLRLHKVPIPDGIPYSANPTYLNPATANNDKQALMGIMKKFTEGKPSGEPEIAPVLTKKEDQTGDFFAKEIEGNPVLYRKDLDGSAYVAVLTEEDPKFVLARDLGYYRWKIREKKWEKFQPHETGKMKDYIRIKITDVPSDYDQIFLTPVR